MIKVKEHVNDYFGNHFFIAEATKINKKVTGNTKSNALKNLKNLIREIIRK